MISERGSPFAQHQLIVPRPFPFLDSVNHILRRGKLPFLDMHHFSGCGGGFNQLRLPAEECGDLQNIHKLRSQSSFVGDVDVGQGGKIEGAPSFGDKPQRFFISQPGKGSSACAVGLAIAGFQDDVGAKLVANFC